MRRSSAVILLACLALVVAGCRTTVRFGPEKLAILDGFRQGDEVAVVADADKVVHFTEDTLLHLSLKGAPAVTERFIAIDLVGEHFEGDTGLTRYRIALVDIEEVVLDPHSSPRWLRVLGWIGVGTLVALTTLVIWAWYVITHSGGGSGGGRSGS